MQLNDAVAELSRLSFEIECDKHAAPAAQRLCPDVRRHLRVMAESGDSAERAEASNAAASAAVDIIWAMGARSQIPCLWRQFNKATKAYEEARWAVHDACLLNRIRTEFFELLSVAGYAEREAIIQFDQETLGNSFWVGEGNIDCWEMDPLILVPGKEFKHIEALSLNCLVPLLCIGTIANDYGVYQMQMQF